MIIGNNKFKTMKIYFGGSNFILSFGSFFILIFYLERFLVVLLYWTENGISDKFKINKMFYTYG